MPHDQAHVDASSRLPIRRWFFRVKGVFLIVSSLAVGVLGWFVLSILAENLRKNPEVITNLPGFAMTCIRHRAAMSLLTLPALICGIALLPKNRSTSTGWLLIIAATGWLLVFFVLILACFIAFMSPLYQYQPI